MASRRHHTVKGMRDLVPPEAAVWAAVEETARRVFGRYGYAEIRTPIVEEAELFARSVGAETDIIGKEMYVFEDRKGRRLALRPESTAAVARAFIEHGMASWTTPVRLFYLGSHFRYERPQRGRYRQFGQIGAELVGEASPLADVELILMLVAFLTALGLEELEILLNSVGDEASRAAYRTALVDYLSPHAEELSTDSRRRLETNPLRILDSKDPGDRELLEGAPRLDEQLSAASRERFRTVRELLEASGAACRVDERLVRGLDYYTETVFEIRVAGLGAQDAIVGGGRYDRLIEQLGGPTTPAVGFAIGQDRLIDALPATAPARRPSVPPVWVLAAGSVQADATLRLAEELRAAGIAAISDLSGRGLGTALRRADASGVRRAVILGDDELAAGTVTLRDLESGEQATLRRQEVVERLREERR